jgi:hypothetical protein
MDTVTALRIGSSYAFAASASNQLVPIPEWLAPVRLSRSRIDSEVNFARDAIARDFDSSSKTV